MFVRPKLNDALLEQKLPQAKSTVTIPTEKFLEKTIEIALDQYLNGLNNNELLKEEIGKNATIGQHIRADGVAGSNPRAAQFKDDRFPTYNANIILDTNFIASAGPRTERHVAEFFYNMIHLSDPVQEIVAFGEYLQTSQSRNSKDDFIDYFTVDGIYKIPGYEIQISCSEIEGDLLTNQDGHHYSPTNRPVRSKLKVKYIPDGTDTSKTSEIIEKEIHVTFHSLIDNSFLDVESDSDENNKVLWEHLKKAARVPVLVHCAAGVGRTGQFILLMELLRHFDQIFLNKTEIQSAAEILYILERIRKTRPGLVWTDDQFHMAIFNAVALRKYALKKGYSIEEHHPILEATPTPAWKPEFIAELADEDALARVKRNLIRELTQHRDFLEQNPQSGKCCFFDCRKYKAPDKIEAIDFLLDLLKGNIPTSGSIMQYQAKLRDGALGKLIRKFAHGEESIGTVRNLVLIAYNTAHKYKLPENEYLALSMVANG